MGEISLTYDLDAVRPFLPSGFVPDKAWPPIYRAARLFPRVLSGFEFSLGDSTERVDFSALLPVLPATWPQAIQLQTCLKNVARNQRDFKTRAVWERLAAFLSQTEEDAPRSVSGQDIQEQLWLEFDLDPDAVYLPIPRAFISFILKQNGKVPSSEEIIVHVERALSKLYGHALNPMLSRRLHEFAGALPPGSVIRFCGTVLSGETPAVRIVVRTQETDDILKICAQHAGWGGHWQTQEPFIANLLRVKGIFSVAMDVGLGDHTPKIGIEYKPMGQGDRRNAEDWQPMFDILQREALCSPAKANGMMGWSGETTTENTHGLHEPLGETLIFLGHTPQWRLVRDISHIKVDYYPNGVRHAKGYLAFWNAISRSGL
ncbi:hypothetical protein [Desulfovibrio inopinatus]|uniref:hypothetical protein n=1 Tax=Desulfovibrio inopinatus TaxID=102109 RepID=UPI000429D4DC|nr:hypothetical protein [Desulfovibrio inopinatus]